MHRFIVMGLVAALLLAILLVLPGRLTAQTTVSCRVTADPSGMIRGRDIPAGCVLDTLAPSESRADLSGRTTPLGPCADVSAPRFYTPRATDVVSENALRLCGALLQAAARGDLSSKGFGPVDRHFQPVERTFEPLQRKFGPIERHFEPVERHFGPLLRPFEPVLRPFGASENHSGPGAAGADAGGRR